MKTEISKTIVYIAVLFGVCVIGCADDANTTDSTDSQAQSLTKTEGDDHDHGDDHDDAEGLHEALENLEAEFAKMQTAFANNDTAAADEPVHAVGHILEHLKELAGEASLNQDQETAVNDAVEELFTHFGELDKQIHAGGDVEFADLEPRISAALTALKSAIPE